MHYYITTLLVFSTLYGCSSRTITIANKSEYKNEYKSEYKKEIIVEKIDSNIIVQREKFTSLEFIKLMNDLDHTLFIELDSKLFRGKDWLEYDKDMKKTLKDFIKNSRAIKNFAIVQEDEEAIRLTKRLLTYEHLLQDVIKNQKFDYVKPAFDKVVSTCNECHNIMK